MAVAALWPTASWADVTAATTLGTVFCNASKNLGPFAPFMSALAYVSAAILAVQGTNLFVKHFNNPNDSQVVKASAHYVGAGTLATLPSVVGTLQKSLHVGTAGGGDAISCVPGAVAKLDNGGLDAIMQNFVGNIYDPMFTTISVISITMGCYLVFRGLQKAAKYGSDPRAAAPPAIIVNLVVGAMLVSVGTMLTTMLQTLGIASGGGDGVDAMKSFAGLNWAAVTGDAEVSEAAKKTMQAMLAFVQVVGGIAFLRGFLMIKTAVEGTGQVSVPQGLTHIIGGAMAINIATMLKIFDNTFGTNFVL